MRSTLRTFWRGAQVIVLLLLGLVMALRVGLTGERLDRARLASTWHRRLLAVLGVELEMHGAPLRGAQLTVANHVSWLDIPVLASVVPLRFVAKAEIRHWPLAGWLATAAGSLYLRRGKGGAGPMLERLTACLRREAVALFPEGTTSDGREVLPFHARLFGAAIDARCMVQPVVLRYRAGRVGRDVAPFIGDDDLFRHVLRVMREPVIRVQLVWCAPIPAARGHRNALAQQSRAAIAEALRQIASADGVALGLAPGAVLQHADDEQHGQQALEPFFPGAVEVLEHGREPPAKPLT